MKPDKNPMYLLNQGTKSYLHLDVNNMPIITIKKILIGIPVPSKPSIVPAKVKSIFIGNFWIQRYNFRRFVLPENKAL